MFDAIVYMPLSLAAQSLGVSWARAWRLVLNGELEGERPNGRWLVKRSSVQAYALKTRELQPPATKTYDFEAAVERQAPPRAGRDDSGSEVEPRA